MSLRIRPLEAARYRVVKPDSCALRSPFQRFGTLHPQHCLECVREPIRELHGELGLAHTPQTGQANDASSKRIDSADGREIQVDELAFAADEGRVRQKRDLRSAWKNGVVIMVAGAAADSRHQPFRRGVEIGSRRNLEIR